MHIGFFDAMIHAVFSCRSLFSIRSDSPSSPGEYFIDEAVLLHRPRQILDVVLKKS